VIDTIIHSGQWLAYVFAFLMGFSMLIYGLLDGYDLGVGMLSYYAKNKKESDQMVSSIGPFWDANETWLVLGVGILLVAFPKAHGIILSNLYIPVFVMLMGLIFRGVAFDFMSKSDNTHKKDWYYAFFAGSLTTAIAQGYMLGSYIIGFKLDTLYAKLFVITVSISLAVGYCLIGANWLIMKTTGKLQKKSIKWAKLSLMGAITCIALVSLGTPIANPTIFNKWFLFPNFYYLSLIPMLTIFFVVWMYLLLNKLPYGDDRYCWLPFVLTIIIAILCFIGLVYSFFPFIIPNEMLIVQASAAYSSLFIIFIGVLIVLPILFGYTFFVYRVFRGKTSDLNYD